MFMLKLSQRFPLYISESVNACVDDRHVFSVIPVVIEGMNRKMPVVVLLCVV